MRFALACSLCLVLETSLPADYTPADWSARLAKLKVERYVLAPGYC